MSETQNNSLYYRCLTILKLKVMIKKFNLLKTFAFTLLLGASFLIGQEIQSQSVPIKVADK